MKQDRESPFWSPMTTIVYNNRQEKEKEGKFPCREKCEPFRSGGNESTHSLLERVDAIVSREIVFPVATIIAISLPGDKYYNLSEIK